MLLDHNVHGDVLRAVRRAGIDCLTLDEDDRRQAPDNEVFLRSIELDRVILASDVDFHVIASEAMRNGIEFPGVIHFRQHAITVGQIEYNIRLIADCDVGQELRNRLRRLPI